MDLGHENPLFIKDVVLNQLTTFSGCTPIFSVKKSADCSLRVLLIQSWVHLLISFVIEARPHTV